MVEIMAPGLDSGDAVTGIRADSNSYLTGDVTLAHGTNITLSQVGNTITINGSAGGVTSFNTRTGAVTLSSGDVTTALGFTPGQGTVTSVSGTTNRITSTGGTTPVIDISASYVGQASITTLGTITTGAVPASLVTAGTFGSGAYTFPSTINAVTGIKINGVATANTILIGNSTNYVPSSYTVNSPGTASNVLTSDGTNWQSAAGVTTYNLVRTMPSAVLDYVNIGSFSAPNGTLNLLVSVSFNDTNSGATVAKQYAVSTFYSESNQNGVTWYTVAPISNSYGYIALQDFALQVYIHGATIELRIQKISSVSSGNTDIKIMDMTSGGTYGPNTFTPSSTTGSAAAVTFVLPGGLSPLANLSLSQPGSFNFNNWNSTGPIGAYFGTFLNNGGSSLAAPQPALVLQRDGVGRQAYDNIAEFNLSRYENVSTNARTQLDIALTNGNSDASGTNVLSLRSDKSIQTYGLLTKYNNITTVSNGVASEIATIDSTGLTANVGLTTLYSVPSTGAGMYRVSAYVVTTTAASVSSTMPNVQVVFTDKDSNTSVTLDVTPILGAAGLGQSGLLTANTVGTVFSGSVPIYVKASTTIQYQTVNYSSTAAGLTYALHLKLEAL